MATELTLEQQVKAFQSLPTHAELCAYFHAHPELARIFGGHHFPRPDTAPAITKTTTPETK